MNTLNISLPEALATFVAEQVSLRGFTSNSEFVGELVRREQDRQNLRTLLLQGASSALSLPVDADYFNRLRDRIKANDMADGIE